MGGLGLGVGGLGAGIDRRTERASGSSAAAKIAEHAVFRFSSRLLEGMNRKASMHSFISVLWRKVFTRNLTAPTAASVGAFIDDTVAGAVDGAPPPAWAVAVAGGAAGAGAVVGGVPLVPVAGGVVLGVGGVAPVGGGGVPGVGGVAPVAGGVVPGLGGVAPVGGGVLGAGAVMLGAFEIDADASALGAFSVSVDETSCGVICSIASSVTVASAYLFRSLRYSGPFKAPFINPSQATKSPSLNSWTVRALRSCPAASAIANDRASCTSFVAALNPPDPANAWDTADNVSGLGSAQTTCVSPPAVEAGVPKFVTEPVETTLSGDLRLLIMLRCFASTRMVLIESVSLVRYERKIDVQFALTHPLTPKHTRAIPPIWRIGFRTRLTLVKVRYLPPVQMAIGAIDHRSPTRHLCLLSTAVDEGGRGVPEKVGVRA